jgi:Cse1
MCGAAASAFTVTFRGVMLQVVSVGVPRSLPHRDIRALQGQWLSPRVVNLTLQYLTVGIRQARTWKLLQPHVPELMQRVLFPLMCFGDEDQELWDDDPLEYIRKVPCHA